MKRQKGIRSPPDGETAPRVGDAMIQLTNDYKENVFNGDIGRVTRVWNEGRALRFSVAFASRSAIGGDTAMANRALSGQRDLVVEYTRSSLDKDIALSYALTIHKAQGSEYPVVVVPILPQHRNMLYRNLLYTGFSRAKQLLVLVGSEEELRRAVANDSRGRRNTLLADRIDDRNFAPPVTRHMSEH